MRQRRTRESPLSIGLTLIAMGLGMLMVPTLLGSNVVASAFKTGLRTPGWIMLGLGAVAVAFHMLVLESHASRRAATTRPASSRRAKVEPSTINAPSAACPVRTTDDERVEPSLAPEHRRHLPPPNPLRTNA